MIYKSRSTPSIPAAPGAPSPQGCRADIHSAAVKHRKAALLALSRPARCWRELSLEKIEKFPAGDIDKRVRIWYPIEADDLQ